ncbi:MAG: thioredoxin domain-containing protein [SAR202 cluster bacterium Io17-Chloro-G3]|nr:MAG: thioredoxin domain-containing protein [SAR202 cluster bacterium Io17-Chloro-G3]
MSNRLINETSPYLLQHSHNPVDWYPWGDEALAQAKKEDKPILLSIGYSACHWCHVMEHESFENEEIAKLMNDNFVSIKVDREERPDLDSIYMQAVVAMTGRGGWPMTVFLTPEGRPFYSGTYFPPEDRHGMPGFPRVLTSLAEAFRSRRSDINQIGDQMLAQLTKENTVIEGNSLLNKDLFPLAYSNLKTVFDWADGGFGQAPKFPQPMVLEYLLRYQLSTKNSEALEMVNLTLKKMARGGIYDQLGGGFHRYSTDASWLVPHFEKMLYDNALLSRLYLHAYQATREPEFARIAQETLDYVLREMTDEEGGFYSSQDADSEGVEGKYFVWDPEEIQNVVGYKLGNVVCHYYNVTSTGNFEGTSILHVTKEATAVAQELGLSEQDLNKCIMAARELLLETRGKRTPPVTDKKVLTAWNGMMLKSLAEASMTFNREDYREAAETNALFLLRAMRVNGRLLRTSKEGKAKLKGYLEDYAYLADGLLMLYEVTFDYQWLQEARGLTEELVRLFWDKEQEVFYDTGNDHEELIVRPRETTDNAMPCGSSVAAEVLLRMTSFTGKESYTKKAVASLQSVAGVMSKYPLGFGHWLSALDFYLGTPKEIAVIGPLSNKVTQTLLKTVFALYLPNKVIAGREAGTGPPEGDIPLLNAKTMMEDQPTAYVCEHYLCQAPVTKADELATQLSS